MLSETLKTRMMDNLDFYLVELEPPYGYRVFWAEDIEHAIEQTKDDEPIIPIVAVYKCELVWNIELEPNDD